jgi:hypothetical protein
MKRSQYAAVSLLIVSLCGLTAWGQPPRPDKVSPEELQRVSGWFKTIQVKQVDPKLLEQLKELVKNNPKLQQSPNELAKKFLEQNPDLMRDPQKIGQLQQLAQQMKQGKTPEGNNSPGSSPQGNNPTPELPKAEPKNNQGMPKGSPANLPKNMELPKQLPQPPQITPKSIDAGNGLQPPGNSPSQGMVQPKSGSEQYKKVAGWWENNLGSLKETPGVQQILAEMIQGASREGDASWLNQAFKGMDPSKGMDSQTLSKIGESFGNAQPPNLPDLGLSSLGDGWGKSIGNWAAPNINAPSSMNMPGFTGVSGGGSTGALVGFVVVAMLGIALWWLWPMWKRGSQTDPQALPGLGPWPVNPRKIADRETLIKAFEYLSVLLCGQPAMNWNHVTIAQQLLERVPNSAGIADQLAQVYAIARYTPQDQPLPDKVIQEARTYLCQLAGVRP